MLIAEIFPAFLVKMLSRRPVLVLWKFPKQVFCAVKLVDAVVRRRYYTARRRYYTARLWVGWEARITQWAHIISERAFY